MRYRRAKSHQRAPGRLPRPVPIALGSDQTLQYLDRKQASGFLFLPERRTTLKYFAEFSNINEYPYN